MPPPARQIAIRAGLPETVPATTINMACASGLQSILLGVEAIWLANDLAYDRFRTARPEVVRDLVSTAPGIGDVTPYGEPARNTGQVPMRDEREVGDPRVGTPMPTVEVAPLDQQSQVLVIGGEATGPPHGVHALPGDPVPRRGQQGVIRWCEGDRRRPGQAALQIGQFQRPARRSGRA